MNPEIRACCQTFDEGYWWLWGWNLASGGWEPISPSRVRWPDIPLAEKGWVYQVLHDGSDQWETQDNATVHPMDERPDIRILV